MQHPCPSNIPVQRKRYRLQVTYAACTTLSIRVAILLLSDLRVTPAASLPEDMASALKTLHVSCPTWHELQQALSVRIAAVDK